MSVFAKHRSFMSYFSFSIATSAVGFASTLIVLWLIPPEEYGRIALFMSMQFVSVPLISFAADNLIAINKARYGYIEYLSFRCNYVTFAYLMFVGAQMVFFCLYLLGVFHDNLFLMIPVVGLVRFLIRMASIEYVMEEKSVQYGVVAFSTALASLLLTILCLSFISGVADWRIAALLIADFMFLFVRYRGRMNLLWTFSVNRNAYRDILVFGFPLLLSVGPAWALNEADKLIVAKYADMATVGYYAAACAVGSIMITFNTALINVITPRIYKELGDNPEKIIYVIKRYMRVIMGATFGFGCLFLLVYSLAVDLILPEKYAAARSIVFVIVVFSLGRSLYSVLGLVTDYHGMTVAKLKGVICGGSIAVIVAILGIMQFGVIGAAVGVGAGYLSLSWVLWFYLVKRSRQVDMTSFKSSD